MTNYNYIEEMMKTAGLKPIFIYRYKIKDNGLGVPTYWDVTKDRVCDLQKLNQGKVVKVFNLHYPDFTSEKQLEIIKLIGLSGYKILIKKIEGAISISSDPNTFNTLNYFCSGTAQDFTQAIAQLTTELMNAGELDKEKVKEILDVQR